MESIVKFEKSAHWYTCRGAEPKAMHDADLRVARKLKLYPSITTVLKDEFKNEFLDRWKTNELLLAAVANYKQPHESDDQFCQRIYDLSLLKAQTAAKFGQDFHAATEVYPESPQNPEIAPWMVYFGEWYQANVEAPLFREKILFDHCLGLAGRCDFVGRGRGAYEGRIILPDWKTQGIRKNEKGVKKPAYYDSWKRQLAFYAVAYAKESGGFPAELPECISCVFDSNEPDRPFTKLWTRDEIRSAYEDVVIASYRWFKQRNYWPQPHGPFSVSHSLPVP